jgi:hypothetical protein
VSRYDSFVGDLDAENQDRADIQERSLKAHWESQLEKLKLIKERHQALGREALVKATQGRIDALNRRMELSLERIEKRRTVCCHFEEIAVGVVRVEDS